MDTTAVPSCPVSDEWIKHHFDHLSPELARDLHPILARAREESPVLHSDQYGGFWVVTGYENVLRIAQDWQTFSSELGITVPNVGEQMKIFPVTIDPPLQREFRRLINSYFRPAVVAEWEDETRVLVNQLIDGFIERGECDFMADFARPLPGLAFFDLALHAPAEDLEQVNEWATMASQTHLPDYQDYIMQLAVWIAGFVEKRRETGPRGDVVDAILDAEIDGRPITIEEAIGTIHLLILGGLETTAGVLGMAMQRFCAHPEIPAALRKRPELIPNAVEELLRMDGSFICIGRTARHDAEVAGHQIKAGEQVMVYWAGANRDADEFDDPETFDAERVRNRHIAFGAGPHRCAGSNLARMNLRIAIEEVLRRLEDLELQPDAQVDFLSTFNRAPLSVPITFTPGPRVGAVLPSPSV
ncbi:Cytochrome P450 [Frankia sp. AiPs1]|uniref:cytochrome P450 n=1 Tax=Frankia sp. AiPa1 TaxID=573492 RepID=UPI00202B990B|nr:cytochrome P450 [Frankia sp. AiPa1]MCL9761611.1 cytochrome P450 [Frankia sp. AiPa1]